VFCERVNEVMWILCGVMCPPEQRREAACGAMTCGTFQTEIKRIAVYKIGRNGE